MNFVNNQQANWSSNDGDWNKYRGPMVSWIRVCSNSAGHPDADNVTFSRQRFVLHSGKGFYQSYGFQPSVSTPGSSYQVIGYTPGDRDGKAIQRHIIQNSLIQPSDEPVNYPIHVPPPEISRMEVTVQKELFRRAQFEWVCFSWKQLVYMTPYFLVPGITCMIEWGWNHFNLESLVNIGDTTEMRSLWDNAYPLYTNNIIKSKGNYDVVYGIITNFNWEIQGSRIICSTEITSKDRLYSGIAKDYGLSVINRKKVRDSDGNVTEVDDETRSGIFKSIRDFLKNDKTINNLRSLVTNPNVKDEVVSLIRNYVEPQNAIWYDILNPLLTEGTPEQIGMRQPWVFGFFSGRPRDAYTAKENFGTPNENDFDKNTNNTDPSKNVYINMGMVVEILNYFSKLDSGAKGGKSMFYVDIQNSLISGHSNLISCDPRVLIPNYQAPKFCYGQIGLDDNTSAIAGIGVLNLAGRTALLEKNPYLNQVHKVIPIGNSIQNKKLQQTFLQPGGCYRNDLDEIINYNRYRFTTVGTGGLFSYSFPAQFDSNVLPKSIRGLPGNQVEKDVSGFLSNVYISYSLLKDAVDNEANASYPDIYRYILNVLMSASDYFWDLILVEVDGTLTIADKKFIGKYGLKNTVDGQGITQGPEIVYSFDYYDADSIIKALKFRPQLSDAQATRTIYGEVNNKDSKFKYMDKNDVLDYKFRDAVIGTPEDKSKGDPQGALNKSKTANEQLKDLIRIVQNINSPSDDNTLKMSIGPDGGTKEIIKLVMPVPQLLRLLLNDDDELNNARYCAVQPGIVLELTLQGIGGLRTFQYFTIKNFPEPYSDRNIIFRITDVHQTLETGNWETVIRAQPMPLRAYIKTRLTGPLGFNAPNNGWPPDPK